ncbi:MULTISPECIES: 4,5-DOPA dioxygenase extradiol [unclassified Saccharicrinis]|uniref:4,5-DOPA-extradiol-dioxygenase n=1 Tax=unclassified Saccharicrinis TaxID=2646859 RepID=UPI003D333191
MKRRQFLTNILAAAPATLLPMKLNDLNKLINGLELTPKMPVLFLGHGSPMNAIEENEFVQGFRKVTKEIEMPKAILCISAHWETRGTQVTAMKNPKTIHDFSGFPRELYEIQYPASGHPELAKETQALITNTNVQLDDKWGLDHGAWSVIKHMYPKANVPVIQLSLDYSKSPQQHYEIGKELALLRKKGVLVVGSGNLVHNLRLVDWRKINEPYAHEWAQEAMFKMNQFILDGNHEELINYTRLGKAFELSIPTPDHYLPLLYILALQEKNEGLSIFNDKPIGGALSMTSVKIG